MVKQVSKPIVSGEEKKYREELYSDVKTVKNKNILCTSCNGSLKELILKGKPKTHPFMDTLLCEKCNSFFGDGEFSVDEDGSDKYCRWCGQGGTLYLCSTCTAGFCKKCIKRNLPRAALKEVEDDDWQCFCCNVKPLYELRAHCWAANKYAAEYVKNEEGKRRRNKKSEEHDSGSESDDTNDSDGARKRKNENDSDKEQESTTVRKSSRRVKEPPSEESKPKPGKQKSREQNKIYKPVVNKLAATLKDAISMTELFKKKAKDCSNKKISLNYINDTDSVIKICGKVDSLLQSVESISRQLRTSVNDYLAEWKKEHGEPGDEEEHGEPGDEEEHSDNKIDECEPKEKNTDESSDKMEVDDDENKKTVNGIEDDEKKSGDEDNKLERDTKATDVSDESDHEHSKKSTEQDKDTTKDEPHESDTVVNEHDETMKIDRDNCKEDNGTNEDNDTKNKSPDEKLPTKKRVLDSCEEDDIPEKETTESSKKTKLDLDQGEN